MRLRFTDIVGEYMRVSSRLVLNKKFWEELIAYFPRYYTVSRKKWHPKFLQFCVCIRCCGKVLIELLQSNDTKILYGAVA
jgi:hypothetical protein